MQIGESDARERNNRVLTGATILLFWMSLYFYVPILPLYATSIGASFSASGLIVASYGLTQFLLRIPLGLASDKVGKRTLFLALGLGLAMISGLGLAVAPSPALLGVFRGIAGAAAATWVVSTVLFASLFPTEKTVKATGVATFLSAFGQVIATGSGGMLADAWGSRMPFLVAAGTAAAGLFLLPLITEKSGHRARLVPSGPLVRAAINARVLIGALGAAVAMYALYATTYGFVPILASELGATRTQLGWLTSAMQMAYVIAAMLVGLFASEQVERILAVSGLMTIGIASLLVAPSESVGALLLTRVLHGLGHGFSYPVLMGLTIKDVPSEYRASAMGMFQALYAIGMFAGPVVGGLVAERSDVRLVFSTTGGLVLATSLFLMWALRTGAPKGREIDFQNEKVERDVTKQN